jgi:hypothetical protein
MWTPISEMNTYSTPEEGAHSSIWQNGLIIIRKTQGGSPLGPLGGWGGGPDPPEGQMGGWGGVQIPQEVKTAAGGWVFWCDLFPPPGSHLRNSSSSISDNCGTAITNAASSLAVAYTSAFAEGHAKPTSEVL